MSVEVRYLSGDSIALENCKNVASVMVQMAKIHNRYATEVWLIDENGEPMNDLHAVVPPRVSVILQPEDPNGIDDDTLTDNLRLHAEFEDVPTCERLWACIKGNLESPNDFELGFVLFYDDLMSTYCEAVEPMIPMLVNLGLPFGDTLFSLARDRRSKAMASVLECRANANQLFRGSSLLMAAGARGHLDVVDILLAAKARVDYPGREGVDMTALQNAAYFGHMDVVKRLVGAGAKVDFSDPSKMTAVMHAAHGGHKDVIDFCMESGADIEHENHRGRTLLQICAYHGHHELVEMLINVEADVNHIDKFGKTPLKTATMRDHKKVAELLEGAGGY